jgi:hypothetical protein
MYTGSNGAAICAQWNAGAPGIDNWSVQSQASGVLTILSAEYEGDVGPAHNDTQLIMHTGDYLMDRTIVTAADVAAGWRFIA